jgi:glyoxylase I family protein
MYSRIATSASPRGLSHAGTFSTGPVHHLRLTVADVDRSRAFYTNVLGFEVVMDPNPDVFLSNEAVGLGLGSAPTRPTAGDRFDEKRVGLDHLSFSVATRADFEAARALDERGVRPLRYGLPRLRQHATRADHNLCLINLWRYPLQGGSELLGIRCLAGRRDSISEATSDGLPVCLYLTGVMPRSSIPIRAASCPAEGY